MKKQLILYIQANLFYFRSCLFFLAAGSFITLKFVQPSSGESISFFHSFGLNVFFVNYTFFGDGIFIVAACVWLFMREQRKLSRHLFISFLISTVLVQLMKQMANSHTAWIYIEASQYLFPYDDFFKFGIQEPGFPSGHTGYAFALATILATHFSKKFWSVALLIAALLVGYSRMYLEGSSLADILAGAVIGIIAALLSFCLKKKKNAV